MCGASQPRVSTALPAAISRLQFEGQNLLSSGARFPASRCPRLNGLGSIASFVNCENVR